MRKITIPKLEGIKSVEEIEIGGEVFKIDYSPSRREIISTEWSNIMNELGVITSDKKLDNNLKLDKLLDLYKQGINIIFMDNPADKIFEMC